MYAFRLRIDCKWRRSKSLNVNRAYKQHVEKQDTQMKTATAAVAATAAAAVTETAATTAAAAVLTTTAHATTFTVCSSPTTDQMMMIICWTCSPMLWLWLLLLFVVVVVGCCCCFFRAAQSFVYAVRLLFCCLYKLTKVIHREQLLIMLNWIMTLIMVVVFAAVNAVIVFVVVVDCNSAAENTAICTLVQPHTYKNERNLIVIVNFIVWHDTCSVQLGCEYLIQCLWIAVQILYKRNNEKKEKKKKKQLCPS